MKDESLSWEVLLVRQLSRWNSVRNVVMTFFRSGICNGGMRECRVRDGWVDAGVLIGCLLNGTASIQPMW